MTTRYLRMAAICGAVFGLTSCGKPEVPTTGEGARGKADGVLKDYLQTKQWKHMSNQELSCESGEVTGALRGEGEHALFWSVASIPGKRYVFEATIDKETYDSGVILGAIKSQHGECLKQEKSTESLCDLPDPLTFRYGAVEEAKHGKTVKLTYVPDTEEAKLLVGLTVGARNGFAKATGFTVSMKCSDAPQVSVWEYRTGPTEDDSNGTVQYRGKIINKTGEAIWIEPCSAFTWERKVESSYDDWEWAGRANRCYYFRRGAGAGVEPLRVDDAEERARGIPSPHTAPGVGEDDAWGGAAMVAFEDTEFPRAATDEDEEGLDADELADPNALTIMPPKLQKIEDGEEFMVVLEPPVKQWFPNPLPLRPLNDPNYDPTYLPELPPGPLPVPEPAYGIFRLSAQYSAECKSDEPWIFNRECEYSAFVASKKIVKIVDPGEGDCKYDAQGKCTGPRSCCMQKCGEVSADYRKAMVKAKTCNPFIAMNPCQIRVASALQLCFSYCPTFVADAGALRPIAQKWKNLGCDSATDIICPAMAFGAEEPVDTSEAGELEIAEEHIMARNMVGVNVIGMCRPPDRGSCKRLDLPVIQPADGDFPGGCFPPRDVGRCTDHWDD